MGKRKRKNKGKGKQPVITPSTGYVKTYKFPASHKKVWSLTRKKFPKQYMYAGLASKAHEKLYDLIIDLAGNAKPTISGFNLSPSLQKLLDKSQVLTINWPDMGIPAIGEEMWRNLASTLIAEKGIETIYVGCQGGVGRTGTALAILAHFMGILRDTEDPVSFVRKFYFDDAIETDDQFSYIERMTGRIIPASVNPTITYDYYNEWGSGGVSSNWQTGVYTGVTGPKERFRNYTSNAADDHIEMDVDYKNKEVILYTEYDGSDIDVLSFDSTKNDTLFKDTINRANYKRSQYWHAFSEKLLMAEDHSIGANLSDNPIHEFYRDGGTDEIMLELAEEGLKKKLKNVKVITPSSQKKNEEQVNTFKEPYSVPWEEDDWTR